MAAKKEMTGGEAYRDLGEEWKSVQLVRDEIARMGGAKGGGGVVERKVARRKVHVGGESTSAILMHTM